MIARHRNAPTPKTASARRVASRWLVRVARTTFKDFENQSEWDRKPGAWTKLLTLNRGEQVQYLISKTKDGQFHLDAATTRFDKPIGINDRGKFTCEPTPFPTVAEAMRAASKNAMDHILRYGVPNEPEKEPEEDSGSLLRSIKRWLRLANLKPEDRYEVNLRDIKTFMRDIEAAPKVHEREFKASGMRDWGFVGDLGHVRELLEETHKFITGTED